MTTLPNSTSERSPPLDRSLEQFPFINLLLLDLESEAQALATDCTRCSSSAFLQPHQLTSGCPQREITAPLLWCLKTERIQSQQPGWRAQTAQKIQWSAPVASFPPGTIIQLISNPGFSFPTEWWLWPQSLTGESQARAGREYKASSCSVLWPVGQWKQGSVLEQQARQERGIQYGWRVTENTLTWTQLFSPGRWHSKKKIFVSHVWRVITYFLKSDLASCTTHKEQIWNN